jgi:multiple sugar transport system ATP-binding protein
VAELRFDAVTKRFGSVEVLRGLDLVVAPGELVVLVGPSGSGKTTALRIAAGLEEPSAGTVRIAGRDVTRLSPGRRNVAMVFQGSALFPHLSVGDNIGFGLRARGVSRAETARRVGAAAEMVGCAKLLVRRPAQLSGGERQRVALARALVREPDAFLLDEPLASLDPHLRTQMRAEIRRLHDGLGATMLHVTHDQHEALTLADRVAVLHDGVIQQAGTPDELYRRPANRFVAGFVGNPSMNVYRLERTGATQRAGPFAHAFEADVTADRQVDIGIRPEDVRLAEPATGGWRSVGQGVTRVVEVSGSDAYVHLDVDGHGVVARVAADARPAVGDVVPLSVEPGRVHRFDGLTGLRID